MGSLGILSLSPGRVLARCLGVGASLGSDMGARETPIQSDSSAPQLRCSLRLFTIHSANSFVDAGFRWFHPVRD